MSIVFNRKLIYQRPSVCDLTKAPGVLSMFKPTRSYTLWSKKRQPPHSYPTRLLLVANIRRTSPKLDWVCSGWILVKLGIFMTRVDMAQTYQLHACAELAPRKYREPLYCIVIYCDPLLCWGHCCCKMYAYISSIVMTQHSIWIHGSHFSQLHCLQMAECLCSQITRVKARGPVGIWGWLAIKGTQACCNNYLEGWAKANFLEQTFGLWMKISDMGWASSSSFNKKRVPRLGHEALDIPWPPGTCYCRDSRANDAIVQNTTRHPGEKMAIDIWFTNEILWCPMVMLFYQRVISWDLWILFGPSCPADGLVMKGGFAFLPQPSSQTISRPHTQQMLLDLVQTDSNCFFQTDSNCFKMLIIQQGAIPMLLDLAVQLRFEGLKPWAFMAGEWMSW